MEQKRTTKKKEEFLKNFVRCKRYISRTCKAIGISRPTFYDWIKKDPGFKVQAIELEPRIPFRKSMFAEAYAKIGPNASNICRITGIDRWTYYHWRKTDPVFIRMINEEYEMEMERRFGKNRYSKAYTY